MPWPKGKPRKAAIVSPSPMENPMNDTQQQSAPTADLTKYDAAVAEQLAELKREREELAALKAKLERKAEIREEVSEAVMEQRRRDFGKPTPAVYKMPPKPEGVELFAVKLERNYAPIGYFETVGWDRPEIKKKGPGGKIVVIQEAAFIKGERAPPAVAGTGYESKVWAGTTIKLPAEEAKHIVAEKIASRGFD